MVLLYWNIGKTIKEEIIKYDRAEYRKQIVHSLSGELVQRYGKGFAEQSLWHMVKFYETYPILSAMQRELGGLSWRHIKSIIYLDDDLKRKFYATLCQKEKWTTRTLQERISSMLYERTALSKLPERTIEMQLKELKEKDNITPELVFRDPILSFPYSCESGGAGCQSSKCHSVPDTESKERLVSLRRGKLQQESINQYEKTILCLHFSK